MKIVGLITEYNPFHSGHKYHIEKAKELTGADYVIVVMSGNFVQRGEPAIMPKHIRCEMALKAGASLVIELPVCYATGSAEYFAYGAVSILEKLGCVDMICFGSECGDISKLSELANIIYKEPAAYKNALQNYIKLGNSYPLARQKALNDYLNSDIYDQIMSSPNNILGIEYLKALYRLNSKMDAYTIQRISSEYHDTELRETFSSASAIRKEMLTGNFDNWIKQIPEKCTEGLKEKQANRYPVETRDFSLLLKYKLLQESADTLTQYSDVSQDLANRIYNNLNQFISFDQFCDLLKTKEVTYSRISRALLHILLDIKPSDYDEVSYAHILGFRKDCLPVFSTIKENSSIPLYTKLIGIENTMLTQDIFASNLYESVITEKFETPFVHEYSKSVVII